MPSKILYLSHVSKMGGAEENLFSLIKLLDKKKYTPILICQEDGELPQRLREIGVEVGYLKMRGWRKAKYFLLNLATIIKLLIFIKKNNIRLVYINPYRLNPYGTLAARLAGIPTVLAIHEFVDQSKVRRFLVNNADKIIVVSDSLRQPLRDYEDRITTIYNGVDLSIFDRNIKGDEVRKEFNITNGAYLVGMIGHLTPWKGHQDLLAAAAEVLRDGLPVKFIIVGDALFNQQLSLEELKEISRKYAIDKQVLFAGARRDIPRIIASLDILVLPSWQESFSRVILEAMAMAKPIIATDCGGPGEIITNGQTGILIPIKRPDLLAEAIIKLLKNPEQRRTLAEAGYDLAREKFDLKNQVRRVESLYNEILECKQ